MRTKTNTNYKMVGIIRYQYGKIMIHTCNDPTQTNSALQAVSLISVIQQLPSTKDKHIERGKARNE